MASRARSRRPDSFSRSIESSRVRASTGGEHRGLAVLDDVLGAADGSGGISGQDLAHDQVVEQGPEGERDVA